MFYSREKEIKTIREWMSKQGSALLLYGKRRVGKTSLIKEALSLMPHLYYECIKASEEENVQNFVSLAKSMGIEIPSFASFHSFREVLSYLDSFDKRLVVVIDEYPYLKEAEAPNYIDSEFQSILDNSSKNLSYILCGSQISMMKDLLREGNPLFSRFHAVIHLQEFHYFEAASFYSSLPVYDKIAFYSVFGGSPYINTSLNPSLSLKDNIIATYLNPNSLVYHYADQLLVSDAANEIQAKRILSVLKNGKKRYNEIESLLDPQKTGKFHRSLLSLVSLGLVNKVSPINHPGDSRKTFYEIADHALRFFYAYVYRNESILNMLGAENYFDLYIAPSLTTFLSHRFEEICRDYFALCCQKGRRRDVFNIGTYYYNDPEKKENGEFDCALALADGFALYEAKYHANPLSLAEVKKELEQIALIAERLPIKEVGFISASGYDESVKKEGIVLLTGEDLYSF